MKTITAKNVNHALAEGFWHLKTEGVREDSRNGEVIVAPTPVCTTYLCPWQRVLFNPIRDANPTFHLMEALWMLAGSNDSTWISQFNKRFVEYAEPDGKIHGAYGARWRGGTITYKDQIQAIIHMLKTDPNSRRAVISMWDAASDLMENKRDLPCNTHIYFDMRGGKLNMTVCNRSNDILWGAYGANVVHMSILQEVIAHGVGCDMGVYRQFSNNFHAYTAVEQVKYFLENGAQVYDFYDTGIVGVLPLIHNDETVADLIHDCQGLVLGEEKNFRTVFMSTVTAPLLEMWKGRKAKPTEKLPLIRSGCDWFVAFSEWSERRAA